MPIKDALLSELEHEVVSTRKMLERVPDDQLDWRPHAKSMTLGELASHIVMLPIWGSTVFTTESFNVAPPGGEPMKMPAYDSAQALVAAWDEHVAALRQGLEATGDEAMMQPWSLLNGEQVFFTLPRVAAVRSMILNHLYHHRGQLSVYLRLLDVPLPAVYGPTADDTDPQG